MCGLLCLSEAKMGSRLSPKVKDPGVAWLCRHIVSDGHLKGRPLRERLGSHASARSAGMVHVCHMLLCILVSCIFTSAEDRADFTGRSPGGLMTASQTPIQAEATGGLNSQTPVQAEAMGGLTSQTPVQAKVVCGLSSWTRVQAEAVCGLTSQTPVQAEAVGGLTSWTHVQAEALCGLSSWTHVQAEAVCGLSSWTPIQAEAVYSLTSRTPVQAEAVGGLSSWTPIQAEAVGGLTSRTPVQAEAVGGLTGLALFPPRISSADACTAPVDGHPFTGQEVKSFQKLPSTGSESGTRSGGLCLTIRCVQAKPILFGKNLDDQSKHG